MSMIMEFFWFLFIIVEILVIIITFYYLKKEYSKAIAEYKKSNVELKKSYKDSVKRSMVKMNITQHIDTQEINKEIGYARLIFIKDGNFLANEKISQNRIRIGRDPRNDIVISDRTVSRKQCLIDREGDKFVLKNYSRINTTRLNGKIVKQFEEIEYGDVVEIGKVKFTFNSTLEAG